MRIGANYNKGQCEFIVWSPFADSMYLKTSDNDSVKMEKDEMDYWRISRGVAPGSKYFFLINGDNQKPDPASNYQPDGVHGASEVIDHNDFKWEDRGWKSPSLKEMIIYELHTGTFTEEGTFKAIIEKLDYLKDLGINMIEIMPVAQFPGKRNWGYDGVYPFAVHRYYGSCNDFKELINECHKRNLGVILDVVYNHLGPEGNYTTQYGPYFTSRYKTEWGDAINFDDAYSDPVRNYFIENALYWLDNFHIDALRLDAVHSIYDMSAKHFLQELKEKVKEFSKADGRERYLIAESDMNDVKIVNPPEKGGYNLDAQWSDDFHHSVHSFLTSERKGYYSDFGDISHIKKALRNTFVYAGDYSAYRKRRHGNNAQDFEASKFVVCIQNHDQVGNRAFGDRMSQLTDFEKLKLAAGLMILSPYIPLLFMGEEYGEKSPFLYFVHHIDSHLVDAVRKGRREEFKSFGWGENIPDPQSEESFLKSKLNWQLKENGRNKRLFNFYKKLLEMRKEFSFYNTQRDGIEITDVNDKVLIMKQVNDSGITLACFNLSEEDLKAEIHFPEGKWNRVIESSSEKWCGPGEVSPEEVIGKSKIPLRRMSFTLYRNGE